MSQGWKVLRTLADRATCESAARETVESGIKATPKCVKVMELVLKNHGSNLSAEVDLLKPGAKYTDQAVGRFIPNPTFSTTSYVFLYVALTRLDRPSGMFSLLVPPEDTTILQNGWAEEEVTLEPGDGLLWRGDCSRKSCGGFGGVMLVFRYE